MGWGVGGGGEVSAAPKPPQMQRERTVAQVLHLVGLLLALGHVGGHVLEDRVLRVLLALLLQPQRLLPSHHLRRTSVRERQSGEARRKVVEGMGGGRRRGGVRGRRAG